MKKYINKQKGFTLFELLVVISIIGILVAIATVAYSASQKKARDAKRAQDMQALQKAVEQYYALSATSSYPNPIYSSGSLVSGTTTIMSRFPVDPKNVAPYTYSATNGSTTTYCYCARLESGTGNSAAACASGTGYYCVSQLQ